ncbi:MAG: hypothetical protein ABSE73_27525 [Planctomycetota bacterium]
METATLSIEVEASAAEAFAAAPAEEKRKMQLLLSLRLRELTSLPRRPLKTIMDDIGRKAEARGMNPGVLDSILHGH